MDQLQLVFRNQKKRQYGSTTTRRGNAISQ